MNKKLLFAVTLLAVAAVFIAPSVVPRRWSIVVTVVAFPFALYGKLTGRDGFYTITEFFTLLLLSGLVWGCLMERTVHFMRKLKHREDAEHGTAR